MLKEKFLLIGCALLAVAAGHLGAQIPDSLNIYKQRVLENIEINILAGYYSQDGANAAVSGGKGTEELTDIRSSIIISIPLNDDDVFLINASVSEYTSASSSNINPFDGAGMAEPFQASSGASRKDQWMGFSGTFSHSSDDRNDICSADLSGSTEYDYNSIGFGGSYTKLFNRKNTVIKVTASATIAKWKALYPIELESFAEGGRGLNSQLFRRHSITGNPDYHPSFSFFNRESRNSYLLGITGSQILSKKLQVSFILDLIQQQGLLSTPFQRVYFGDIPDSFIESFQLADDIERLPDARFRIAIGGRLNYYINDIFVVRNYYRYYTDEWGSTSHTANIILPVKIANAFTLYPSFRFYRQTAVDYFAPYEQHLSTDEYYTSDYDLSQFSAKQLGFGLKYTDIFSRRRIWRFGLKSIDLQFRQYERNSAFKSSIITAGIKFILE